MPFPGNEIKRLRELPKYEGKFTYLREPARDREPCSKGIAADERDDKRGERFDDYYDDYDANN